MKKKKKIQALIILMILMLVLLTDTSYALWQLTFKQTGVNTITTGFFKLEFQKILLI